MKRVLADKAYSYDNFEFLQSMGPAILVRKRAIDILIHPRSEEARRQRNFNGRRRRNTD